MNKKVIYILIGLAIIFFVTSLIIFLNSSGVFKRALEDKKGVPEVEEVVKKKKKVKIFFLTEKSAYFRPVKYELDIPENNTELYRNYLDLMFDEVKGRIAPFPEGVKLKSFFHIKNKKMIVLDFNEELLIRFPGGSRSEIEFIYFFVNNICYNFKEVEKVKFLVSGNEYKTLSGHLDIENPFFPNFRYIRDEQ
ncbi:MAG: GerMN domain-containing protein [Acidobacteriota bacterium]